MKLRAFSVMVLFCGSLASTAAVAQDKEEKKLGWADKAELSLVLTSGNSQTSTFGFRNDLSHDWDNARLLIEVAGLRTETGVITRTPVGSSRDDFEVQKSVVKDVTAENYLARGKYDRNLTDRFFLCLLFIHPRAPNLIGPPICRDYACMISSFVRTRPWARPQTQTLSC